jgi:hypothetical protein
MDLHSFTDRLSESAFSQAIQVTSWAIPFIQTVHILALAILFACALVLALRFMGRGLKSEPLARLAARSTTAIWALLLVLLLTGSLLIIAEPGRTITNPVFYAKMIMLAAAAALTLWLSASARRGLDRPTGLHTAAATCTLLLWAAIIVAGRFIAYVESY